MFTGSGNGGSNRINQTPFGPGGPYGPFSAYHHHQHQQQQLPMLLPPHPNLSAAQQHHLHPPPQSISSPVSIGSGGGSSSGGGGGGGGGGNEEMEEFPRRDERFPQWGIQETREFIAIRIELEAEFAVAKRNSALWDVVAARMREKGYYRTPLQCCTKWENLITSFKEKETIDPENSSHFPFSDVLHEFLAAKEKEQLLDTEAGSSKGRKRVRIASGGQSSEEFYAEEEKNESGDEDRFAKGSIAQRKKVKKEKSQQTTAAETSVRQADTSNHHSINNSLTRIREMLHDFFQQQQKIDVEWMESMEKRARERELFEQEWRKSMEKLERERLMVEQAWREKEEQRRIREESRAEKREALLTALLNKLIHD